MKLFSKSVFLFGLISSAVVATEYFSPIENVHVYTSELTTLSIQNLSNEQVDIDVYGEVYRLVPASGLQFECQGYDSLEIQFINNNHDYFEVPCQSKVVISELFSNQFGQGE